MYPELLDFPFFVTLEFNHIFLEFFDFCTGCSLFFLGYLHSAFEVSDSLFGRFDIISDL